ncbi:MAG TPA: PD-(D/E)XK nuclease family protein [Anaerolineales bacterium]|jgi:CRISPR/Cas system-associated exonuclease Cas4 (RecB family)|nr:PD-(D/E)XK nuclease family protein [Anaerolineales bacterium]HQX16485.1 PD-(D/E)XK nuclease family protein [Anaerolineales bacterium]
MPAFQLTTLSQSSLQDYVDCARRFQLRYLERLSYPAIESEPALENEQHQREGEFFHRLAQQYLIGIPSEQVSKLANTPNLKRWWENFSNALDLSGFKNLTGLYPEATLSAPLGNFRLLAKYDLIAIRENKATIYDWKTYRKRPRNEWLAARMQTRVYRALLVHAGAHLNNGRPFEPEQIEMVYWFADFPNDPARFAYTSAQYKRDWDLLEKLSDEIQTALRQAQDSASLYPLTDDATRCLYCPYRSYCERGVRAGEADQAEAETEAEELFDVNFEQVGEISF